MTDLTQPAIALTHITQCSICGGYADRVIDLPAFPLTGIYLAPGETAGHQLFDQGLLVCRVCGHAELATHLPPDLLYGYGYAHRSSASHLSSSASDFFRDYVGTFFGWAKPRLALEIGCNDLVLLRKMAATSDRVVGVDPLWRDQALPADLPANVNILGRFVEELTNDALGGAPDLIYSTHNLEHIGDPVVQYRRLMEMAASDALFVIEVPDSTLLARHARFDQVFHQHYHYFTLASMLAFIEAAGGSYVAHTYNYRNWGGSLSVAFSKAKSGKAAPTARGFSAATTEARYAAFRTHYAAFKDTLLETAGDGPLWGYGAGQMVPAVAYHLQSDLSFLTGILDDNPDRAGLTYATLPVTIQLPSAVPSLVDASVVILALDGVRPINERLRALGARYILTPANVY